MAVMTAKDHQKMAPVIPLIKKWATSRGIPYAMLYRQVWKESRGNKDAVGDFGNSRGLMQINKKSAGKEIGADFDRLFEPEYNMQMGTAYLMKVRSLIQHLLPKDQTDSWGIVFMGYNSGHAYVKKALERIRSRGVMEPTLKMVLEEMNSSGFGRTPIFSITVPYATFIATGVEKSMSEIVGSAYNKVSDIVAAGASALAKTKPLITMPLALGLGAIAFLALKFKKGRA